MEHHSNFFTHGNTIIYLKSIQCERIQLSKGISRDYIKVMSDSNVARKIWSGYLFSVFKGVFRTLRQSRIYCITCSSVNDTLDLTVPGLLPTRFKNEIKKLATRLNLPLVLAVTKDERKFLLNITKSKTLQDIESLVKSISLVSQPGSFTYFSIALTNLPEMWQSELLTNSEHKETWYQMHVYSEVFDSAFLFDKNFNLKRSECHASTIKYLKKVIKIDEKEKDVKVDLILFNRGHGDIFTCEDKPEDASESAVQVDIEKANKLREKRLLYLKSIIPYPSNLERIEVLSAQFYGLTLTIYGSRITEHGDIVHYQKAKAQVPPSPLHHLPQVALFLMTVIPLQRNIALSLKKLEIIYDSSLQDTLECLSPPVGATNTNLFFREDSPVSEDSNDSDSSNDWIAEEQQRRTMESIEKNIKDLDFGVDVLTVRNWEDFISP